MRAGRVEPFPAALDAQLLPNPILMIVRRSVVRKFPAVRLEIQVMRRGRMHCQAIDSAASGDLA